jgi:hypothetical protein
MSYVVRNLTNRPVLLTLTTGEALRLSPGETSAVLADVAVANNEKLNKLAAQRVIAIDASRPAARATGRRTTASEGEEAPTGGETPEESEAAEDEASTSRSRR